MVMGELTQETEVLVIGGGPGGYAAAFRAADLGMDVTMVDMEKRPGGVCLYRGCIPSKTFLFLSELIHDAKRATAMGVRFETPTIDLEGLRAYRGRVVEQLSQGLVTLSQGRGVQRIQGRAVFESSHTVRVVGVETSRIRFQNAIIATGSYPIPFPGKPFTQGSRIMDSSGALALADIPETLLIVGGGYVGLELGSVYAALGSRVVVVELGTRLLPGVDPDPDLVRPLHRTLKRVFENLHLETRVASMEEHAQGVDVTFSGLRDGTAPFHRVLVAVGRRPNSGDIGLENTNVELDQNGFIHVDSQQRTADNRIFAVGDVVGGVMLAHKATYEGKIAAEVIAGEPAAFDARAVPAVVYTDPQIAWAGISETEARRKGIPFQVQRFPWKASGRALTMDAPEGLTKIIADPETQRIIGVGCRGDRTLR